MGVFHNITRQDLESSNAGAAGASGGLGTAGNELKISRGGGGRIILPQLPAEIDSLRDRPSTDMNYIESDFSFGTSNAAVVRACAERERPPDLIFTACQSVLMQEPEEPSYKLHERLRYRLSSKIQSVNSHTVILQPFSLTLDLGEILGIANAVAVPSTNCVHEFLSVGDLPPLPYPTFVGIRDENGWFRKVGDKLYRIGLQPLGRELTQEDKHKIYDALRVGS